MVQLVRFNIITLQTVDIKPGCGEEAVTIHNLEEYIDRLAPLYDE